jgi:hypothetical protein
MYRYLWMTVVLAFGVACGGGDNTGPGNGGGGGGGDDTPTGEKWPDHYDVGPAPTPQIETPPAASAGQAGPPSSLVRPAFGERTYGTGAEGTVSSQPGSAACYGTGSSRGNRQLTVAGTSAVNAPSAVFEEQKIQVETFVFLYTGNGPANGWMPVANNTQVSDLSYTNGTQNGIAPSPVTWNVSDAGWYHVMLRVSWWGPFTTKLGEQWWGFHSQSDYYAESPAFVGDGPWCYIE